jgi:uncharacterized protein (TIGR03790 family)
MLCAVAAVAQPGASVLLVVNRNDPVSGQVAEYYRPRRSVPTGNVCYISTISDEEISFDVYEREIQRPIADCLSHEDLRESIVYIVLTMGVPLKVQGGGSRFTAEYASVDSELTLLYGKLKGAKFNRAGPAQNPFYSQRDTPFSHARFPIYLVTRLAGYDLGDVKAMIDRSLAARNRGKFVIDLQGSDDEPGNNWLRNAALLLPASRVLIDQTPTVLYDQKEVIAYASWGSNDSYRKRRRLGFQWLPGAIASEYVSTNARTLKRPPENWTFAQWADKLHHFGGSGQSLTADLLHEGATGASGNVYEPFLQACARPDYLLPAYFQGRNLAESFYLALPYLSWQGVVFGDPLCSLGKP